MVSLFFVKLLKNYVDQILPNFYQVFFQQREKFAILKELTVLLILKSLALSLMAESIERLVKVKCSYGVHKFKPGRQKKFHIEKINNNKTQTNAEASLAI